jgi:tRNA pseudouridine55 synthase
MKKDIAEWQCAEGELLLLDKPYGWSSFAVVNQLKKWTNAKIGHAGTLDPLASGLMICCTGKWTKKLTALTGLPKEYLATIHLGATTQTYDLESLPENKKDISAITKEAIEDVINQFKGDITQFPPIHSAIKQEGKPIYALARKGKEVIVKSRNIHIASFDILSIQLPEIKVRIACSSGTYIRSIANDIGVSLGCGAYLQSLSRTKIGEYRIEDSYSMHGLATHFGSAMHVRIIKPASEREYIQSPSP